MKHLFIGGPVDGQYFETLGAPYYAVAVMPHTTTRIVAQQEASLEDLAYHRAYYFAHRLPGGLKVYTPEDWSIDQTLATLIRRYPASL